MPKSIRLGAAAAGSSTTLAPVTNAGPDCVEFVAPGVLSKSER